MARRRQQPVDGTVGEIGVHDPFELIRHLARSQSDPRKAVAELVQNALDEQASHITIERFRDAGESALSILDDGRGVLPELPREQALTTIAKNIGHSRKRQLSFDERMRQAMLGQYGIGLLGFWAIGHELQIRSRVGDSEVWVLTLFEDSPRYTVTRIPDLIDRQGTWTEVQVRRIHRAAMTPTAGGRLATYLSVEMRGQLVLHGTELSFIDRLARGTADKRIVIRPSELSGERLPGIGPIAVDGYAYPIELALHYAGDAGADAGRVRLSCAGAVVLSDITELEELAHPPWDDPRLCGVIDFPHLEVPPGSRRGIVPNAAAAALVEALKGVGALVSERLEERAHAEAASLSEDMHKQLAKLFTRVTGYVPHLEWFPVARRSGAVEGAPEAGSGLGRPPKSGLEAAGDTASLAQAEADQRQTEIFPPGPLDAVTLRPAKLELPVGESRTLTAEARDATGRPLREGVSYVWRADELLQLSGDCARTTVTTAAESGDGCVTVIARQGERERSAVAPVRIVAARERRADAGVPQPEEINEPLQSWRSRLVGEGWQINVGHPDYRALSTEARPRLRYLAMLLSKEVVSRNFPQPGLGAILEELVGLLAALERSGAWSGRSKEGG